MDGACGLDVPPPPPVTAKTKMLFSGSDELMVVKWCFDVIFFSRKLNVNENTD